MRTLSRGTFAPPLPEGSDDDRKEEAVKEGKGGAVQEAYLVSTTVHGEDVVQQQKEKKEEADGKGPGKEGDSFPSEAPTDCDLTAASTDSRVDVGCPGYLCGVEGADANFDAAQNHHITIHGSECPSL